MEPDERIKRDPADLKSLVVVFSYHHNNTEQIAHAIAGVLGAPVKDPRQVKPDEVAAYDLVGFGSGIYSATFGRPVLDLADRLLQVKDKKAFLFSTYGAPSFAVNKGFVEKNHEQIREKLRAKKYTVIGEFACAGWNTNSFLKFFGGINKGRPNAEDLRHAVEFAQSLKEKARETVS